MVLRNVTFNLQSITCLCSTQINEYPFRNKKIVINIWLFVQLEHWRCNKHMFYIFFVKINRGYKPELSKNSPKILALCSPFLGWCPWGWIQVHDERDNSKPQENSELAIEISWPLRTVFLILSKAFYFKMRVRERNKFQTLSLPVCKICSQTCIACSGFLHTTTWLKLKL